MGFLSLFLLLTVASFVNFLLHRVASSVHEFFSSLPDITSSFLVLYPNNMHVNITLLDEVKYTTNRTHTKAQ
jgi:hypothetical protein